METTLKRTVVVLILILFATLISCSNEPYTGGFADISIIIISDTTTYEENEDCKLLFIFKNIGKRGIAYYSVLPIYGGPLYFKFSGNHHSRNAPGLHLRILQEIFA